MRFNLWTVDGSNTTQHNSEDRVYIKAIKLELFYCYITLYFIKMTLHCTFSN